MRRALLLLCLLAIGSLFAYFFTRTRAIPLPVVDAPQVHVSTADSLEDATAVVQTRESQSVSSTVENPRPPPTSTAATAVARVHGRVVYTDTQQPVPNASVVITYMNPEDPDRKPKPAVANTMPDGRYSIRLPAGVLLVEARVLERESEILSNPYTELRVDAYVPVSKNLELRPLQSDLELDLEVGSGMTAQGQVLEVDTGQPIVGARVVLENGEYKGFGALSGADGRFTVRGITYDGFVKVGHMATITATHDEFVRDERRLPALDAQGRWPEVTLLLGRGLSVGGIVVDASGKPVPGLQLRLRPLHGSPQAGLSEYEGEWKTSSDPFGIFLFPKIPAFDRAWLVTDRRRAAQPGTGEDPVRWAGASRTLLHGKDPFLPSIELRLQLEFGVEVVVSYPDGTIAGPGERLVLREDDDGRLRSAHDSTAILCFAGRATRLVALGKPRATDEDGVVYRGETVVAVGVNGPDPRAEIQLTASKLPRSPLESPEVGLGGGLGGWTNSTIILQFVDRSSGAPLPGSTKIAVAGENYSTTTHLGKDGRVRLDFEPGWETLKLTVEGYQAYTIELEVKDNEPQTLTLPLDRLP